MCPIDQRGKLEEESFSYRLTKDQRIMLFWYQKHIKTLVGKDAKKFVERADGLSDFELQLLMAKATGHFKHGNEKNIPPLIRFE